MELISEKDKKKALRSKVYVMIVCFVMVFSGLNFFITGDPFGKSTAGVHTSPGIETRMAGLLGVVFGSVFFRLSSKQYKKLKNMPIKYNYNNTY